MERIGKVVIVRNEEADNMNAIRAFCEGYTKPVEVINKATRRINATMVFDSEERAKEIEEKIFLLYKI